MIMSGVDGQGASDAVTARQQQFDAQQLVKQEENREFNSLMATAKTAMEQSKI
jgi:hypothetical protein